MLTHQFEGLLHQLTEKLLMSGYKIATAESCTGGLIASLLTDLPGSSQWFDRGFVTYSNEAKQEMLDVSYELIHRHGAVSQQVAEAMVLGALHHSQATLAIAVTGIAGPEGGSVEKPVGTVWLAFASRQRKGIRTQKCFFSKATRHQVRSLTCEQALLGALALL